MKEVFPKEWSTDGRLNQNDKENIERQILEEANKICTRRRTQATQIEAELTSLKSKQIQLQSFVSKIKESIVAEKSPEKRDQVESLCNMLLQQMNIYVDKLTALQKRFANQKIRILAFGSRSQGKSSFIKAYTGLSEEVISVKGDGKNEDWTGATSIIIHKKGIDAKKPNIFVVFKEPQSIIDTVNVCFEKLGLKYRYSDWNKLYQVLRDSHNKKQLYEEICSIKKTEEIDVNSYKRTLESIFKAESDFSDIEEGKAEGKTDYFDIEKGKRIEIEDLPKYNYMQNPECQKYMAVAEIHILADLKHGGMFENMEVCDTKGTSVAAGGDVYEKELYSVIGSSDAVFSIQMTGSPAVGESDEAFYVRLKNAKNDYGNYLKDLDLRHFAIINMFNNSEKDCFKGVFQVIKDNGIANTAYAGVLKEDAVYDGNSYSMSDFVDYVIHDMMKKIVVTTNRTDENLLKESRENASQIDQTKKRLLMQLLDYADISPLSEDDIVRNQVEEWLKDIGRCNTMEAIEKFANKAKVSLLLKGTSTDDGRNHSQSVYESYVVVDDDDDDDSPEDNNVKSESKIYSDEKIDYTISELSEEDLKNALYEILTGESKLPKDLKDKNDIDIIKAAVKSLYLKLKSKAGKDKNGKTIVCGNKEDIGAYIDSVARLMFSEVIENVNRKYAPCRDIPGAQDFKDNLFKIVWDQLKLDIIYSEFDGQILKKESEIKQLKHWSIAYNHKQTSDDASPLLPPPSFVILKNYFGVAKMRTPDELITFNSIVEEDELVDALQNAYLGYDLVSRCKQKQYKEQQMKSDVCRQVYIDLQDPDFCDNMIELYKYLCPHNYIRKLKEADIIDGTIEEECENQKRFLELKNLHKYLSDFSL